MSETKEILTILNQSYEVFNACEEEKFKAFKKLMKKLKKDFSKKDPWGIEIERISQNPNAGTATWQIAWNGKEAVVALANKEISVTEGTGANKQVLPLFYNPVDRQLYSTQTDESICPTPGESLPRKSAATVIVETALKIMLPV